MSNQAFMAAPGTLAGVSAGGTVVLDGPEGHHAVSVKRVRSGERIDILDGSGRRALCTVASTGKASLEALVEELRDEPAPAVSTVLVQALAKGDRDLQAVESAVELGVDRVVPWQSERCVVRWQGDRAAKGRAKWEATVRAAVKQSRRAWLPSVGEVATTASVAALLGDDGAAGQPPRLAVVLHEQAEEPLAEVVSGWLEAAGGRGEVMLLVGPEGGISDAEVERLRAAGAVTATLGRNVLRASTAGPAALVLVRHLAGLLG